MVLFHILFNVLINNPSQQVPNTTLHDSLCPNNQTWNNGIGASENKIFVLLRWNKKIIIIIILQGKKIKIRPNGKGIVYLTLFILMAKINSAVTVENPYM